MDANLDDRVQQNTCSILGPLWMDNFAQNIPQVRAGKSIGDLPKCEGHSALVIGAGPSVEKRKHLDLLASSGYKGIIFSTDRMLIPCLKKGVIPNYVVSVDGNGELIQKFFDDPIVKEYGKEVKVCATTTVHPNTIKRINDAGIKIYWFHGMLDSLTAIDSLTYWINKMAPKTIISCGGNCGTTSIVLAYYLKCNPIGFIGMDFGYLEDARMEDTSYYHQIKEVAQSNSALMSAYVKVKHPFFNTVALTDLVFLRYRDAFLKAIEWTKHKQYRVINMTEGGIIFGLGVEYMWFKDFLKQYKE